jgi:hypothetical protein
MSLQNAFHILTAYLWYLSPHTLVFAVLAPWSYYVLPKRSSQVLIESSLILHIWVHDVVDHVLALCVLLTCDLLGLSSYLRLIKPKPSVSKPATAIEKHNQGTAEQ